MKSLQTKNFKLKTQSKSAGFTLIELLVVIAIIGILSSVVLASLSSARIKARDSRRSADIQQLQSSLELYNNDYSGYPDSGTSNTYLSNISSTFQNGDYIASLPQDPNRGVEANGYQYYAAGGSSGARSGYLIRIYHEGEGQWCKVSSAPTGDSQWSSDAFCNEL